MSEIVGEDSAAAAAGARRPSFQFYPGDWRNNANLGRCSFAARGAWVDVMCVLHDSAEYGVVRWPLKDLANSAKVPMKLLRELVEKEVLKGIDKGVSAPFVYVPRSARKNGAPVTLLDAQEGPIWFSSRMVKDEYRNTQRGKETRFGEGQGEAKSASKAAPNTAPKASPTRREGEGKGDPESALKGDGSSTSSSSSTALRERDSVADATAAADAAASDSPPLTDREKVWMLGVPLLGEGGRGLLGKLAKACGEAVLVEVLVEATRDRPAEPRAWLVAACEARKKLEVGITPGTDILGDPRPAWALNAGFPNRFEAENAGCLQGNAHLFREGQRTQ